MRSGKVVLIMQARMGSTRLPGKSMMLLAGEPLIYRIIERVKRTKRIDDIVLATTEKKEDDVLSDIAKKNGIKVFRGSKNDLVDRYYKAALKYRADIIVRLPADNPVVEPEEIDRIVDYYKNSDCDFAANTNNILGNEYPDGLGAEVFSIEKLREIWEITSDTRNREHPHTYFYENTDKYKIGTVKCPEGFRRADLVLDVNTKEDYDFIAQIYNYLYPKNSQFHIADIIRWYDNIYNKKRK